MADTEPTSPDKKRQEPPPIEFVKPGEVPPTAPPQDRPAAAWVTRPEDYQRPQYAQPPAPPRAAPQGTGNRARIAGILLIVAAGVSAAVFLANSLIPPSASDFANATSDPSLYALGQVCGFMVIWGQAIMVLAGVMAYQRMNWRMAMGCAFFAMLMLGGFALAYLDPIALGAAFLAIVGFVLTVTSRGEFRS